MDTADRMMVDILASMCPPATTPPAELRLDQALRNLAACYRKAQKEPLARIPSYLEAAIQNLAALK